MPTKKEVYINRHTSCYWDQCSIRLLDDGQSCKIQEKTSNISTLNQPYTRVRIRLRESKITTWVCATHIKDI